LSNTFINKDFFVKKIELVFLTVLMSVSSLSSAVTSSDLVDTSIEIRGTLKRYLMNPRGEISGMLLTDGAQIKFLPSLSSKVTAIISPDDTVRLKGFKESKNVFTAHSITNFKTQHSVDTLARFLSEVEKDELYGNTLPKSKRAMTNNIGFKKMIVTGTIQHQLFDDWGRVNAVILSDDSIVYLGKTGENEANVYIDVGRTITAKGYGTQNAYGKTLDAEILSNQ
jgi:hypothetical protein